jgi:hypothetical protein
VRVQSQISHDVGTKETVHVRRPREKVILDDLFSNRGTSDDMSPFKDKHFLSCATEVGSRHESIMSSPYDNDIDRFPKPTTRCSKASVQVVADDWRPTSDAAGHY